MLVDGGNYVEKDWISSFHVSSRRQRLTSFIDLHFSSPSCFCKWLQSVHPKVYSLRSCLLISHVCTNYAFCVACLLLRTSIDVKTRQEVALLKFQPTMIMPSYEKHMQSNEVQVAMKLLLEWGIKTERKRKM